MSTYSKAPRGLLVHVEVSRVFTAIAISPSKLSRQLLARYAIDAGQNSPGKELRYLRTVHNVNFYDYYDLRSLTIACKLGLYLLYLSSKDRRIVSGDSILKNIFNSVFSSSPFTLV